MDQQLFADLQQTLESAGVAAAIEQLCAALRERKEYSSLFYALLLKKRHEMGAAPMPTGPGSELPPEQHQTYEEAIRTAGRLVGQLFLAENNIPRAWSFYQMLGEPEPVAEALEKAEPTEDDECQQLIEIAYYQGVHPRRGFDFILDRYGICSAITTLGGQQFPHGPAVRDYCLRRVAKALHVELVERLRAEILRIQGFEPTGQTIGELIAGRDWLFGEDSYHLDMSHLGAVVQLAAVHLQACPELNLVRELCAYGLRMAPRFRIQADPPFDDYYRDYSIFLAILAGDQVEEGLAHFHAKVAGADPDVVGTFPAEVLVNLLLRIDRPKEALAVARQYLVGANEGQLSCPGVIDLCQRTHDYAAMAEVARAQQNPVNFLAGLMAARSQR